MKVNSLGYVINNFLNSYISCIIKLLLQIPLHYFLIQNTVLNNSQKIPVSIVSLAYN